MTPLAKPVKRSSAYIGPNRRQYVVELAPPDLITFRDVRSRKRFTTTLRACYEMAIRVAVSEAKAAKRKGKK
jgi:hypothetical protein